MVEMEILRGSGMLNCIFAFIAGLVIGEITTVFVISITSSNKIEEKDDI